MNEGSSWAGLTQNASCEASEDRATIFLYSIFYSTLCFMDVSTSASNVYMDAINTGHPMGHHRGCISLSLVPCRFSCLACSCPFPFAPVSSHRITLKPMVSIGYVFLWQPIPVWPKHQTQERIVQSLINGVFFLQQENGRLLMGAEGPPIRCWTPHFRVWCAR